MSEDHKRTAAKLWTEAARADCQCRLLKRMKDKKLGSHQVDKFLESLKTQFKHVGQESNHTFEDRVRQEVLAQKVKDARKCLKLARRKKEEHRRQLRSTFDVKSWKNKNIIKHSKQESDKVYSDLIDIHDKKLKFLTRKKENKVKSSVNSKSSLPPEISKYSDLKCFDPGLTEDKSKDFKKDIPILAVGVTIDDEEKEILKLPPKFSINKNLNVEEFELAIEEMNVKIRWENSKKDLESIDEENDDPDPDAEEALSLIEATSRQVFDQSTKTFTNTRRRATDLPGNTRVHLLKALSADMEARLQLRKEQFIDVFNDHVKHNCNSKGNQKNNLTKAQSNVMIKLQKRMKNGELVVTPTDKTGCLSVIDRAIYEQMGAQHTKDDKEVSLQEVKEIQRKIMGHCSLWTRFSSMGTAWGHEDRVKEVLVTNTCNVAPMYLLTKDHEVVKPGQLPASRPVVSSREGMSYPFSNIISDVIEPLASNIPENSDVVSTEDLLSKIDRLNEQLHKEGLTAEPQTPKGDEVGGEGGCDQLVNDGREFVMIGADAEKLYPSLNHHRTAQAIYEAALITPIEWEDFQWQEQAKYIAVCMDQDEYTECGVARLIPTRKSNNGVKPQINGEEMVTGVGRNKSSSWVPKDTVPTRNERRLLIATCLKIAVLAFLKLHVYQFMGKLFLQMDGGPIGERATACTAKVRMAIWTRKVKQFLRINSVQVFLMMLYVDDARYFMMSIQLGIIFNKKSGKLEFSEEQMMTDKLMNLTPKQKTCQVLLQIMNHMEPDLSFTVESTDDFESARLPTLDTEMWTEKQLSQSGDEVPMIKYSFFRKPLATPYVVMENTALSWNSRRAILSQEVLRRGFHLHPELPHEEKMQKLGEFQELMRNSGYTWAQIREVMTSGLMGLERKTKEAKVQNTNLHRSSEESATARCHRKLLGKSSWFKPKTKTAPKPQPQRASREERGKKVRNPSKHAASSQLQQPKAPAPPCSVIFCPRTPGGELVNKLRAKEQELAPLLKHRMKIVEESGTPVKQILCPSNPWAHMPCNRWECLVCNKKVPGEEKASGNCYKRNVIYSNQCLICKDLGITTHYVGDSGRSCYERTREHLSDARSVKGKKTSHIRDHLKTAHPEINVRDRIQLMNSFQMRILKEARSPLARQLGEALTIRRAGQKGDTVLNGKEEYTRCFIPMITVEGGPIKKPKSPQSQPLTRPTQPPDLQHLHLDPATANLTSGNQGCKRKPDDSHPATAKKVKLSCHPTTNTPIFLSPPHPNPHPSTELTNSPDQPLSSNPVESQLSPIPEFQDDDIFLEVPLDALKSPDSPDPILAPLPNLYLNTTTPPHPPIPSDSPGNLEIQAMTQLIHPPSPDSHQDLANTTNQSPSPMVNPTSPSEIQITLPDPKEAQCYNVSPPSTSNSTFSPDKLSTPDQLSCTAGSPTKPRSSDALDSVKDSTEILNYLTDPAPTRTQLNTTFNEVPSHNRCTDNFKTPRVENDHNALRIINSIINEVITDSESQSERLLLEFEDTDYLMLEYKEECRSLKPKKSPKGKFRKGKGKAFEFEMSLVERRIQEFFMFLGISLRKGFRETPPCPEYKGGIKRLRNGRKVKSIQRITEPDTHDGFATNIMPADMISTRDAKSDDTPDPNGIQGSEEPMDTTPDILSHPVMLARLMNPATPPRPKPRRTKPRRLPEGTPKISTFLVKKERAGSRDRALPHDPENPPGQKPTIDR